MGGSQLSQLKAALHQNGLSRSSSSSSSSGKKNGKKKQRTAGAAGGIDAEARRRKLESISQSLNAFETQTGRQKHKILGAKPAKGSTGRPGLSRQAGIENRKRTLLPQYLDRDRSGGIVDRRFGEDNPTLTPEERALQRFTLERQRKAAKNSLFNLGDNEEAENGGDDDRLTLTHYGQSLADVRVALPDQEDFFKRSSEQQQDSQEDAPSQRKKSRAEIMEEVIAKSKAHKYERQKLKHEDDDVRLQLDDDLAAIRGLLGVPNVRRDKGKGRAADLEPPSELADDPSSAASVNQNASDMPEDIDDEDEQDESEGDEEDEEDEEGVTAEETGSDAEFDEAPSDSRPKTDRTAGPVTLTFVKPPRDGGTEGVNRSVLAKLLGDEGDDAVLDGLEKAQASSSNKRKRRTEEDDIAEADTDDPYDRFVRELAFEKRAAPSDRLKTGAELAQQAAEELQKHEQARLKRMRGEDLADPADEVDEVNDFTSSRERKAKKGKQRAPEGDDLEDGFELDGDEVNGFGLGGGLQVDGEADEEEDSDGGDLIAPEDGDSNSDADSEDEEGGSGSDSGSEKDENEMLADLLHPDEEESDAGDDFEGQTSLVDSSSTKSKSGSKLQTKKKKGGKELPFTFPCPSTHAEFLDILEETSDDDLPVVIERIRTLYHPSLAEGNKQKLATFLGVLLDHLIYTASCDTPSFAQAEPLLSNIFSLAQSFPITCATQCIAKLSLMQKNLTRGLQAGPLLTTSKTWPGAGELSLLRTIGVLWSTSDFSHPVAAPAMLLICQYLGQCRIRQLSDLSAGMFLCSLVLQYESMSKRFVPEAINFLAQSLVLLFPLMEEPEKLPGDFPMADYGRGELHGLLLGRKDSPPATRPTLLQALSAPDNSKDVKAYLAETAIACLSEFASMYNTLPAFIELVQPVSDILGLIDASRVAKPLQTRLAALQDSLSRMLKFSRQARKPLTLQSHKPIPIPSFIPKFDAAYAPGRRFDPDVERNEAAKLKALVKKEKKGAIRELRKDNRFIAGERAKMEREKDDQYKTKINRITAGLEQERSEEKRFERTKEREKLRDKKRAGGGKPGGRR